jgi:hypothetical protein
VAGYERAMGKCGSFCPQIPNTDRRAQKHTRVCFCPKNSSKCMGATISSNVYFANCRDEYVSRWEGVGPVVCDCDAAGRGDGLSPNAPHRAMGRAPSPVGCCRCRARCVVEYGRSGALQILYPPLILSGQVHIRTWSVVSASPPTSSPAAFPRLVTLFQACRFLGATALGNKPKTAQTESSGCVFAHPPSTMECIRNSCTTPSGTWTVHQKVGHDACVGQTIQTVSSQCCTADVLSRLNWHRHVSFPPRNHPARHLFIQSSHFTENCLVANPAPRSLVFAVFGFACAGVARVGAPSPELLSARPHSRHVISLAGSYHIFSRDHPVSHTTCNTRKSKWKTNVTN